MLGGGRLGASTIPRHRFCLVNMLGTLVNAAAIAVAGLAGVARVPDLPVSWQRRLSTALGALTLALGFHVIVQAAARAPGHALRVVGLAILAFFLGRWTGGLLRLQQRLNRLGQYSNRQLMTDPGGARTAPDRGSVFAAATVVFCLTPLAMVGPVLEALAADRRALAVKAVLDALAALALGRTRGSGVALAALPVLALQGTLTLALQVAQPRLIPPLAGAVLSATAGLILLPVSLVMLQVTRVRLADYLPVLLWAALLGWWFRPG